MMDGTRRREGPQLGCRFALAFGVRSWASGGVLTGGSPWRVAALSADAQRFVEDLRRAGVEGVAVSSERERRVARDLIDRGFVHPVAAPQSPPHDVTVVVPAHERPASLRRCLAALEGLDVLVVDDASTEAAAIASAAHDHHARLLRRESNGGPGAARNSGVHEVASAFVAFVDSDCVPEPGWLDMLMAHFDDPLVAAVAPRVHPDVLATSVIARYELTRSALDMGRRPELVRPGARLGFVPTATLVARRSVLEEHDFDERLRVGEDVDLVWRLIDAGWLVRYEPRAAVVHETRTRPSAWLRRRFDYGTSAAALARRHPGRLAPVRASSWSLGIIALLIARRPRSAALVATTAAALLGRRLGRGRDGATLAATIVGMGTIADAAAIGHALRREWWPLGLGAFAAASRSKMARAGSVCMLAPVVLEWLRDGSELGLGRYIALRFLEDGAYGTGVLTSAGQQRTLAPLIPDVRLPSFGRKDAVATKMTASRASPPGGSSDLG
jgi:mycofactocin system glycosyltransferase